MHFHSRPRFPGTLRSLPNALPLLLRTCLAASPVHAVTQSHAHFSSLAECINACWLRLLVVTNFLVPQRAWQATTLVGMLELTAVCGIGSALWVWSKRSKGSKGGEAISSDSLDTFALDATGKCSICSICGAAPSRGASNPRSIEIPCAPR